MSEVRVAAAGDVAPETVAKVTAGAQTLALVNSGGRLYALGDRCPHAGGPLSEGFVENGTLRCPWHARHFDPATGRCVDSEATKAASCFAVTVRGDDVFVEIEP